MTQSCIYDVSLWMSYPTLVQRSDDHSNFLDDLRNGPDGGLIKQQLQVGCGHMQECWLATKNAYMGLPTTYNWLGAIAPLSLSLSLSLSLLQLHLGRLDSIAILKNYAKI